MKTRWKLLSRKEQNFYKSLFEIRLMEAGLIQKNSLNKLLKEL